MTVKLTEWWTSRVLTFPSKKRRSRDASTTKAARPVTSQFGRETWALVVPEGWRAQHEPACATLVGPDDIGAFQVSAYFRESDVLDGDLRDFASEHLDAGVQPTATRAGDFTGFEIAFSDSESCWRHWYLRNGRQMLFVTYNCDLDQKGTEDGPVLEILGSLVATGGDGA